MWAGGKEAVEESDNQLQVSVTLGPAGSQHEQIWELHQSEVTEHPAPSIYILTNPGGSGFISFFS